VCVLSPGKVQSIPVMLLTRKIALWLFVVCLPVLLLSASVSVAANSLWLYRYGFDKFDVGRVTGLAPAELDKAARGLIGYFNSGEELIDITVEKDGRPFTLFNEREVAHLKDVKGLFRLVYKILLGSLVYALLYLGLGLFWWRDKQRFSGGLFFGGCLTLALMLVMGLLIAFDFDRFFRQFHLLSFANDFWMLDPASDYLIMLFPRGFWLDAALFCALAAAAGALILGGIGWWLMRKYRI
jgi:integral membrane protein (TIGR01906 family)